MKAAVGQKSGSAEERRDWWNDERSVTAQDRQARTGGAIRALGGCIEGGTEECTEGHSERGTEGCIEGSSEGGTEDQPSVWRSFP